jgi:peptide/nickel transport system permease protein
MKRFVFWRSAQALVVLIIVSIIVFSILHFLPGSPARAYLGVKATPGAIRQFNIENGYNRSLPVQYWLYVDHLFHGNLGFSYHFDQSVSSLLRMDLPKSALLVGLSYVFALLIAIPLGIVQALRRGTLLDHSLTTVSFVGYSMPTFWLGMLLIVLFSVQLHLLPSEGPQGASVGTVLQDPRGLILPVLTLTIVTVAQFSRFVRSSAIDTLLEDFVRTAVAKGVSRRGMVMRHLLRNSLLPVVTLIGLSLPGVLSGAIIVEALYNYPGMGWLFWTAATSRDYATLMGFTIVVGAATVIGNLAADVVYAAMDPRIRYQSR